MNFDKISQVSFSLKSSKANWLFTLQLVIAPLSEFHAVSYSQIPRCGAGVYTRDDESWCEPHCASGTVCYSSLRGSLLIKLMNNKLRPSSGGGCWPLCAGLEELNKGVYEPVNENNVLFIGTFPVKLFCYFPQLLQFQKEYWTNLEHWMD